MNSSNKYFLATILAGAVVMAGLTALSLREFYPAYQAFLEFCGLSAANCQRILSGIAPASIVTAGVTTWLLVIFLWQLIRTYLVVGSVLASRKDLPNYLEVLGLRLGLAGRIKLVRGNVLFCAGYLRPQVVIGRGILNTLSTQELEAALSHESYHVRNLDPLKVLLTTTLARAFFFLPAVGELARGYLREKEQAADLFAESIVGRVSLSKALYKVLARSNPEVSMLPALTPSFVSYRGEGVKFSSWALATTLLVATFTLVALVKPHPVLGTCQ
jgi:Zn-dependent protease with chaperone function